MNVDRVQQLLDILDKSRQWPTLKGIHDKALDELTKISNENLEPVKEPVRPFRGVKTDA